MGKEDKKKEDEKAMHLVAKAKKEEKRKSRGPKEEKEKEVEKKKEAEFFKKNVALAEKIVAKVGLELDDYYSDIEEEGDEMNGLSGPKSKGAHSADEEKEEKEKVEKIVADLKQEMHAKPRPDDACPEAGKDGK